MNRLVIYLGLSFLIAFFLLPCSHAADEDAPDKDDAPDTDDDNQKDDESDTDDNSDTDDGTCTNIEPDDACDALLSHCYPTGKDERDKWMDKNCKKACFYGNPEDCKDARDDCASRDCENKLAKGQCMKTCGTCPEAK